MTVIKAEQSNKRQQIQQKLRCHRQTDYNGVIYDRAFQERAGTRDWDAGARPRDFTEDSSRGGG